MISAEWRDLNADLHRASPDFGGFGSKWRARIEKIVRRYGCRSVLDYGCGKATLALKGFDLRRYDPAIPDYAGLPEPADLVVCTDVLEHVEPEHLDDVLDHLRSLTLRVGFLTIGTRLSDKTMPDGRNAHLILEPMYWWLARLGARWTVVEAHDSSHPGHWADRGLKSPPLDAGREFSAVVMPWSP